MSDININLQCECYHRRGVLYYANPLAWGRPCRRCRRMMSRNVVVVPTQVGVPVATTNNAVSTTTTFVPVSVSTY
ncbi:uncharacterized protein LOC108110633 [Drosophila eugracilis]|uniref:uncharacterized protein LOC108110633 n=1 Tax=Drosophila eugracilis TaxID=29029 RepID=UPI001BD94846|nr:uncharacterized protein LOC108110633 [Drosophila eugracilis]